MLYAAKIDGSVKGDELGVVLAVGNDINQAALDMTAALAEDDSEVISIYYGQDVDEEKAAELEAALQELFASVHDIFAADGRHSAMENHLMRVLKKILTK